MYKHVASVSVSFEVSRRISPPGDTDRSPSALMECFVLPTVASHCLTHLDVLPRGWPGWVTLIPCAMPQFHRSIAWHAFHLAG